jgi:hypothetical protein
VDLGVQISCILVFGIQDFKFKHVIPKCFVTCFIRTTSDVQFHNSASRSKPRKTNIGQADTMSSETESSILQTIITQAKISAKVSLFSTEVVFL